MEYSSGIVSLKKKTNHNRECDCGQLSATLYLLKIKEYELTVCPNCLWLLRNVLEARDKFYS